MKIYILFWTDWENFVMELVSNCKVWNASKFLKLSYMREGGETDFFFQIWDERLYIWYTEKNPFCQNKSLEHCQHFVIYYKTQYKHIYTPSYQKGNTHTHTHNIFTTCQFQKKNLLQYTIMYACLTFRHYLPYRQSLTKANGA